MPEACPSCLKPLADHVGIVPLCFENKRLKQMQSRGGKSRSKKKIEAAKVNAKKARKARWG